MATNKFNLPGLMGGLIGHNFITNPARGEAVTGALLFATDQDEEYITGVKLSDYASGLALILPTYMKTANTGDVVFEVEIMAIEDGVGADVEVASFDAVNSSGAVAVAGTAKYPTDIPITCSNDDSPAGAAVGFMFRISRNVSPPDDAAGDAAIGPVFGPLGSYTTT
ncbi:hypothetical protein KAR91_51000 [Candidatus Pacearchaeota archaeon]|nr:hypothetical protein [Candidatus Pacearchaeota archaeon]